MDLVYQKVHSILNYNHHERRVSRANRQPDRKIRTLAARNTASIATRKRMCSLFGHYPGPLLETVTYPVGTDGNAYGYNTYKMCMRCFTVTEQSGTLPYNEHQTIRVAQSARRSALRDVAQAVEGTNLISRSELLEILKGLEPNTDPYGTTTTTATTPEHA